MHIGQKLLNGAVQHWPSPGHCFALFNEHADRNDFDKTVARFDFEDRRQNQIINLGRLAGDAELPRNREAENICVD